MGGKAEAFERIKRLAGFGDADGEDRLPYRCRGCGSAFDVQYHVGPECGGYSVDSCRDAEPSQA